ncbi:ABC transporter ATP-binding protein [Lapidilactobacillus luobeiensis]|uniref:ABC transporter ATP-binding protein n=1 Tax=Lapidilactobacillus luobeiensis TaxID=2950371 RepID=UPI0021C2E914|nr:ABC transporter ATP-binding protein [Lapidilactobacillus luobeiensis]
MPVFKRLLSYFDQKRYLFGAAALLTVGAVVGTLIAPVLVGQTIDQLVGRGQVDFTQLNQDLLLLLGLYLISNLFLWLATWFSNTVAYTGVNRLRTRLFAKIGLLPLRFFDTNPHGDVTSRFVNDVEVISDGVLQGLLTTLQAIFTIVGAIVIMVKLDWVMALMVLITAPLSFLTTRVITTRSQGYFKQQADDLGTLNGYAEETIAGLKIAQAFQQEIPSQSHFENLNQQLYRTGFKSQFISSFANPSARAINNIMYAIIGMVGGLRVISGQISVGEISSFLIFATIFGKPFSDFTSLTSQFQSAYASAKRIFKIIDLTEEQPDPDPAQTIAAVRGAVAFDHVAFSYERDQKLITDLNLTVRPGQQVAIVGQTGAGKTTLVNLLMRFYDVTAGKITLDGVDIRQLTRQNLRQQFGLVLQDTWLFAGTIRENIAFGKPDADLATIKKVAAESGVAEFIEQLPQAYDTELQAATDSLSVGQRQLLTIARVMLANPPMLILDEATSNIDTYTEVKIQQAFNKLTAGRTSFVIAHRLSTIRQADLILVMDHGQVIEQGTHQELLAAQGYYARLYESQFAPA